MSLPLAEDMSLFLADNYDEFTDLTLQTHFSYAEHVMESAFDDFHKPVFLYTFRVYPNDVVKTGKSLIQLSKLLYLINFAVSPANVVIRVGDKVEHCLIEGGYESIKFDIKLKELAMENLSECLETGKRFDVTLFSMGNDERESVMTKCSDGSFLHLVEQLPVIAGIVDDLPDENDKSFSRKINSGLALAYALWFKLGKVSKKPEYLDIVPKNQMDMWLAVADTFVTSLYGKPYKDILVTYSKDSKFRIKHSLFHLRKESNFPELDWATWVSRFYILGFDPEGEFKIRPLSR